MSSPSLVIDLLTLSTSSSDTRLVYLVIIICLCFIFQFLSRVATVFVSDYL